jgi:hypothetical protein
MAKLRDHPIMNYRGVPAWPPLWTQTRRDGVKKLSGELGVLIYVHASCPNSRKCYLVTEYENENYLGTLLFDDPAVCSQITTLLEQNLRKPIKEIGDLDLGFTL